MRSQYIQNSFSMKKQIQHQIKQKSFENKIEKVKNYLAKLEKLMECDKKLYEEGYQALQKFHEKNSSSESEDSFLKTSNDFRKTNKQEPFEFIDQDIHLLNNLSSIHRFHDKDRSSQISEIIPENKSVHNHQEKPGDITLKKIKVKKSSKKFQKSNLNQPQSIKNKNIPKNVTKDFINERSDTHKKEETLGKKFNKTMNNKSAINTSKTENKFSYLNLSPKCNSPVKFNLNLEKEIVMKINNLKTKKNLCQIQSLYLEASLKVTKKQIQKAIHLMKSYSEESILNTYMVKIVVKFLSQFEEEIYDFDLLSDQKCDFLIKALSKPDRLIKIINKLPEIIRKNNVLSEKRCKQLFEENRFVGNKIEEMDKKYMYESPLYQYLRGLVNYIEFLLNNNMIHETKRIQIFTFTQEELYSQRSHENKKKYKEKSSRKNIMVKDYDSERKMEGMSVGKLKKINTSNNLKKESKLKKIKKN